METPNVSPGKFSINHGVILGMIMVVIAVTTYVTGLALDGAEWPNFIYYLIFPVIVIYAISQFKKRNANFLSLSEALKVGVMVGVISALIFVVYNLIFNYVIDPGFTDQMMEVGRDKMLEKNPDMTDEMIDKSMGFMEIFFSPFVLSAFWLAMSAIFGLLYGLIGGLVMKKENTHA